MVGDTVKFRNKPRGLYFSQALFEGLIFGRALYIRRGLSTEGHLRFTIDWASLIFGSKFTVFALCYFVFESKFPSTSPQWGSYLVGLIFGILRYDGTSVFSLSLIYLYVYFFADTSDRSIEATQYFCVTGTSQQLWNNENHYLSPGGEGAGTLYNGLYRETPPARGTIFMLQVYERVSSLWKATVSGTVQSDCSLLHPWVPCNTVNSKPKNVKA